MYFCFESAAMLSGNVRRIYPETALSMIRYGKGGKDGEYYFSRGSTESSDALVTTMDNLKDALAWVKEETDV